MSTPAASSAIATETNPGGPAVSSRKTLINTGIGNALEWYDWSIYATFSIYFAREIFNPQATALQASLLANVVLIIPCRCGASSPTSGASVRR